MALIHILSDEQDSDFKMLNIKICILHCSACCLLVGEDSENLKQNM